MQWFENAKVDEKIRAIYHYLNNGDPIDAGMLSKLFRHLYPETDEVMNVCFSSDRLINNSKHYFQGIGESISDTVYGRVGRNGER